MSKEQLKEAVGELNLVDTVFEYDGVSYIDTAVSVMQVYDLIDQLDEPEVLSQKWVEEHRKSYTMEDSVEISDLQNLLVPKQEELESTIKVLIEAYKQEEGAHGELENGWIRGFIKDLENLVEEESLYCALVKGHELITNDDTFKYWNFDTFNNGIFLSNRDFGHERYLTEMSKAEWNELGINDSNADFVKEDEEFN